MTDKQIIIDDVLVKDCCYFDYENDGYEDSCYIHQNECSAQNCYYKQLKRKEQECKELKETLAEIKGIAEWHTTGADSEDVQEDMKQILQKIRKYEVEKC